MSKLESNMQHVQPEPDLDHRNAGQVELNQSNQPQAQTNTKRAAQTQPSSAKTKTLSASKSSLTTKRQLKLHDSKAVKTVKPSAKKIKPSKNMTRAQIQTFFSRLRTQRPEPKTELNYNSAFELLIAVMLSAQATDVSVNKATDKLFPIANTPAQILALGVDGLKQYIKTIGLYNAKAENVMSTCALLLSLHNGEVPDQREALEALPGVGRKTANVVLNTAFGQAAMAVDTHIFRVGNRTGLARGANVLQVEQRLIKVIPAEFMLDAHHWLILHGRYCCTARRPKCGECVVSDVCNWPERFDYGCVIPSLTAE